MQTPKILLAWCEGVKYIIELFIWGINYADKKIK